MVAQQSKASGGVAESAAPLVFWDGYGLDDRGSGVFVHARSLADELKNLGCRPILVGDEKLRANFADLESVQMVRGILPRSLSKSKLAWPIAVRNAVLKDQRVKGVPFVLHGLSNLNLPITGKSKDEEKLARYVVTVHDLIPFLAPNDVSVAYQLQFSLALPLVTNAADLVVCVSEWTRKTLLERYPGVERKTVVIANAAPFAPEKLPRARSRHGGRLNVLSVSRDEKYKNLDLLVKVLALAKNEIEIDLVTNAAGKERLSQSAASFIEQGVLRLHSRISNEALTQLHAAADVYVQPSRFEGYCLPAATSLSHGVPVVYQGGSGIDEVVPAGAGVALPPAATPIDWRQAIVKCAELTRNPGFAQDLAASLAARPTWKDSAKALLTLYNGAITAR